MEYRKNNPDWDKLPYDLEFNAGNTVGDIVSKFIGLYPNMQAYFDIYNNFCANVIPSCENNPIDLDNDYIQKILIGDNSENVTYDTQSIYNVTEVFGKIYDINRLSETCTTSNSVYNITLESYDSYTGYEYIAFTPNTPNISNMHLKINSLSPIPIYKEYTTEFLPNGTIQKGEQYVVLIKRMDSNNFAAYFLGQYQPHALCVLTNNINDTIFTKDYFANKYNCNNIILREEKESPFTIQKIGEVLDVKSGEEFDSIISDTVALENAIYHNRKASSLHDTVTITTKLIPWLDVMCKIEYKRANENEIVQYLVQNITHNIENGTSTIVMSRFYPLYYS